MLAVKAAGTTPAPTFCASAQPKTHTPRDQTVDLAWEFNLALADRLALRYDLGYGVAHVNSDVAASPDLNTIRVLQVVDTDQLRADAAHLFGNGPRHIAVRDHDVARAVLPGLVRDGYIPRRTLILSRTQGPSARPRSDVSLRGTSGNDDANLDVSYWLSCQPYAGQSVIAQLRLADLLRTEPAKVSRMSVWAPSPLLGQRSLAPVSRAIVTTVGDVTELGRVYTAPEHRGRCYARTAVHAALAQRSTTRVFSQVSTVDPALRTLRACGMTPQGVMWHFTRNA